MTRGQAVDSGEDDLLNGRRDLVPAPGVTQLPSLLERLGDLFHEEGIAIGALGDHATEGRREVVASEHRAGKLVDERGSESGEADAAEPAPLAVRPGILGAVSRDRQDRHRGERLEQPPQKLLAALVDPVQVLDQQDAPGDIRLVDFRRRKADAA